MTTLPPAQTSDQSAPTLDSIVDNYSREHRELLEAMALVGVAQAEYDRAIRAMAPCSPLTTSTTLPWGE